MKYGLAVLACIGIFFVYIMIGAALGWRHGGGAIPMFILIIILGATWRGITKSTKMKKEEKMTGDES